MIAGGRRVVVTGMGAVTALGQGVEPTWDGLVAGRSGVRTIASFDPSRVASRIAAEVVDFDPSEVLGPKDVRRTDRYIQFGLVAAREALEAALVQASRLPNPGFSFKRTRSGDDLSIERTFSLSFLSLLTLPVAARIEGRYFEQTKLPPWTISSVRPFDSLVVDLYNAVEDMDPLRLGLPVKWREVKWRR